MKNQKGSLAITLLVLFLVILSASGVYIYYLIQQKASFYRLLQEAARQQNEQQTKKNSELVNQNSFTNTVEFVSFTSPKYKYSIDYPKNWTILEGEDIDAQDKEKSVSFLNFDDKSWIVIKMLDQKWEEIKSSHPWINSPIPATLAGATGIEGEESAKNQDSPKIAKYMYLKHPILTGTVISIRVQGNNEEILNKVLNTLKFN